MILKTLELCLEAVEKRDMTETEKEPHWVCDFEFSPDEQDHNSDNDPDNQLDRMMQVK